METYLAHHGILGMKWGVRRYQNEDGTLTDAGKARLAKYKRNEYRKLNRVRAKALAANDANTVSAIKSRQSYVRNIIDPDHTRNDKTIESNNKFSKSVEDAYKSVNSTVESITFEGMRSERRAARAMAIGAGIAGAALGSIGGIAVGELALVMAGSSVGIGISQVAIRNAKENVRYRIRKYNDIMSRQNI